MTLPNFSLPPINTDMIIAAVVILLLLYGLLLGHGKLKTFALSAFVGIVMVFTFSEGLFNVLKKANLTLGGKVSLPVVKIGLFVLPVIALEFTKKDGKRRGNMTMTLVLCVLTAALLISSVFSFLDSAAVQEITKKSMLADWIYQFRLVWLAAVPIVVIAESLAGQKSHH